MQFHFKNTINLVLIAFTTCIISAQEWQTPMIEGYGKVKNFTDVAEQPDPNLKYQLLFDITATQEKEGVNFRLWVMARTLNMLAVGGVPVGNIDMVAALHGEATFVALNSEAYQKKYGKPNPNIDLINKLVDSGVKLFVCSQATASRGVTDEMLLPNITPALSALSVISNYQIRGYHLMP